VSYLGHTFTVPAGWPVIDLSAHPATCVRFDTHAVYLGRASSEEKCPDHAFGRTDALQIEPAPADAGTGATEDGVSHEITSTGGGVSVTATYSSSAAEVNGVLASGGLPVPATSAVAPAAAAQAGLNVVTDAASATTAAATVPASAVAYTGEAFDACSAPSSATMAAWQADSTMPYGAIGIYIGGVNEGCSQPNLTASWVATEAAAGWHFFLLYVGPQAPGSSCTSCSTITSATTQGVSAAQDAETQAAALGFGTGTPIVYDMEAYPSTATSTVLSFMSAWTAELHGLGYSSGEYSSLDSGITDLVNAPAGYLEPDMIDFADWDGDASTTNSAIPTGDWPTHQRIHQYSGGTDETYGGVEIDVDQDYMDVDIAASVPPPTTAPPAVLNDSNGTLSLYTVRTDGNVWADSQSTPAGAFGGWQPLSTAGDFTGTPAVIETSSGIIGVYARTTSGEIMGASQAAPGDAASSWVQIGSATDLVSSPTVLLTASGVIAVYSSDATGAIDGISQYARNSAFGSWQTLSPDEGFAGRPAVIQTKSGVIAIYATTSGTILGTSQSVPGGPFSSWSQLGTASDLVSDPTALITNTSDVIAIYAADSTGGVSGISQSVPYGPFGAWTEI
jgi:hypothetical protein